MSSPEFSLAAQEAMREAGGWNLAGDDDTPPSTVQDFDLPTSPLPSNASELDIPEMVKAVRDPSASPSLDEQISLLYSFFGACGLQMPTNFSTQQHDRLEQTFERLSNSPDTKHLRLIAAPLFDAASMYSGRLALLSDFRDSGLPHRLDHYMAEPLRVKSGGDVYNILLQSPLETVINGQDNELGLFYPSATTGQPVNRETYIQDLVEQQQLVFGSNETAWTYNFFDMGGTSKNLTDSRVHVSVESLLVTRMLAHVANEVHVSFMDQEFANETIYKVVDGRPDRPIFYSNLDFADDAISLNVGNPAPRGCVRQAEGGLQP